MLILRALSVHMLFFFFNDTATTEIYTLSLHDALPISDQAQGRTLLIVVTADRGLCGSFNTNVTKAAGQFIVNEDRKSTRLNSSHANISYAVFCLKKKKNIHHALS